MHSPFKSTLINANMRYIYWPHYDGDPTSYWERMGYSFIGGPQVLTVLKPPVPYFSVHAQARLNPGAKGINTYDCRLFFEAVCCSRMIAECL